MVFRGVVAYHFEGDCLHNIVFGIDQVSVEAVVGDGTLFSERFRQYAWPRDWNPNVESIQQFFERVSVKLFELHSSYGIGGWIAASSMEQVVLKQA